MTTKEEVLQSVKILAEQKLITRMELDQAFEAGSGVKSDEVPAKEASIAGVLSCIGGVVVFIGLVILVVPNWSTLGFGTKVLATLGTGVAAYFVGLLFGREQRTETIGAAFLVMSALVLPLGLGIVFDHAGFVLEGAGLQSSMSGMLFALYLISCLFWRRKTRAVGHVLMFFSICFGTWLYFSLTRFMGRGERAFDQRKFFEYRLLVAGIIYMLLGRAFSKQELAQIRDFLYGFGSFGFLGAALSLGGWDPAQNVFWELIYPGLVFGAFYLSVQLKNTIFLAAGTLFLMAYIIKITAEYFSSGLGWPLTLIITGLAMIGVGYMSLGLKRKYLSA